jgi:transposase
LPCCKAIRLKDSTSIQLPEHLKDVYPGSGGSKACLKIQFEYDLKTGNILDLSITPFTTSDLKNSYQTFHQVNASDLIIRDLGYISLEFLKQIHLTKAFYLNRIKSNISIWIDGDNQDYLAVDWYALEKQMRRNRVKSKELTVYLGEKKELRCRLIIECIPEDIKKEKLRKAHRAGENIRQLSFRSCCKTGKK